MQGLPPETPQQQQTAYILNKIGTITTHMKQRQEQSAQHIDTRVEEVNSWLGKLYDAQVSKNELKRKQNSRLFLTSYKQALKGDERLRSDLYEHTRPMWEIFRRMDFVEWDAASVQQLMMDTKQKKSREEIYVMGQAICVSCSPSATLWSSINRMSVWAPRCGKQSDRCRKSALNNSSSKTLAPQTTSFPGGIWKPCTTSL